MEKPGRDGQATDNNITWRMRFARLLTKATNTHTDYIILSHGKNSYANASRCYIICLVTRYSHRQKTTQLSIVNRLRAGRPGSGKTFVSFPNHPACLWGPTSTLFDGYRVSFPGVHRPQRERGQFNSIYRRSSE